MKVLLIDDTRDELSPEVKMRVNVIARDYFSGIDALMKMGPWDLVLLDHDLNTFIDNKEFTGYNIACFLEENAQYLPKDIKLISSNPPGRARQSVILSRLYNKDIK